jgi:hypothetical protein
MLLRDSFEPDVLYARPQRRQDVDRIDDAIRRNGIALRSYASFQTR